MRAIGIQQFRIDPDTVLAAARENDMIVVTDRCR
jgi:hypothetical protein